MGLPYLLPIRVGQLKRNLQSKTNNLVKLIALIISSQSLPQLAQKCG